MAVKDSGDQLTPFKESLKDVVSVVEKLAPFCSSLEELVSYCALAVDNDVHCWLIYKIVTRQAKK
jgi:hypothetical protein